MSKDTTVRLVSRWQGGHYWTRFFVGPKDQRALAGSLCFESPEQMLAFLETIRRDKHEMAVEVTREEVVR